MTTDAMNADELEQATRNIESYLDGRLVDETAEHEDTGCPEDDTCECPLVVDVNEAFKRGPEALAALETELKARDERIAELEGRRREMRQLLHRLVKYVREDRASTPGVTRLARLTDQVADYLSRTNDPNDALRGDHLAGGKGDG
jgi:hypothetical protein